MSLERALRAASCIKILLLVMICILIILLTYLPNIFIKN